MNQIIHEDPGAACCQDIRRIKRKAFIMGMSVMAAVTAPLMAGSYALGLLGYQVAHWGFP